MHIQPTPPTPRAPAARRHPLSVDAISRRMLRPLSLAAVSLCLSMPSHAVDFGPFSLTGFGKVEIGRGNSQCPDCGSDQRAAAREPIRIQLD